MRAVAKAGRWAVLSGLVVSLCAWSASGAGYIGYDSEEPGGPVFAWDDISTTGTLITTWAGAIPSDDEQATLTIPFSFTFMGTPSTTVSMCSNGFVEFGGGTSTSFSNSTLPAGAPTSAIFAFWDDLYRETSSSGRFATLGTAPNRRFVMSWLNYSHFPTGGGYSFTFQVALYETSNAIVVQYLTMTDGTGGSPYAAGQSATVGIQGGTGFIEYEAESVPLSNNIYNGLAIGYLLPGTTPPWGGGGGGGGGAPGGGGPGGFGPGGASRGNSNGDQGLNDVFCGAGLAGGSLLWMALALGATMAFLRRR